MPQDQLQVIQKIEKSLQTGRPMSLHRLSKVTGLHYTTVKRYVNLLDAVKKMPEIEVIRGEKTTLVRLARKLSLLPEEEQNKIIKFYMPKLEEDTKLLIELMEKGIISEQTATRMRKTKLTAKLLKQEQLKETKDGRIYLTEFGQKIAQGAKSIYGQFPLTP